MSASILPNLETEIEEILDEMLKLERQIAPMAARIEEIRQWCKIQGSFSTRHFVCAVKPQTRRCLSNIDTISRILGYSDKELIELGLMRVAEFLTVRISRKGRMK